jgi:hypothetical protein
MNLVDFLGKMKQKCKFVGVVTAASTHFCSDLLLPYPTARVGQLVLMNEATRPYDFEKHKDECDQTMECFSKTMQ